MKTYQQHKHHNLSSDLHIPDNVIRSALHETNTPRMSDLLHKKPYSMRVSACHERVQRASTRLSKAKHGSRESERISRTKPLTKNLCTSKFCLDHLVKGLLPEQSSTPLLQLLGKGAGGLMQRKCLFCQKQKSNLGGSIHSKRMQKWLDQGTSILMKVSDFQAQGKELKRQTNSQAVRGERCVA